MSEMYQSEAWRLDRRVTLGLVLALAVQTAGALIWAGGASERLDQLEARTAASGLTHERLARLEEHAVHTRAALDRIERRLDDG